MIYFAFVIFALIFMNDSRIPTRDIVIYVIAIFAIIFAEYTISQQTITKPQETQVHQQLKSVR